MSDPTIVEVPVAPKRIYKEPNIVEVTVDKKPVSQETISLDEPEVKKPSHRTVVVEGKRTDTGFIDLSFVSKEYGESLTKEDILADPRLMELIRQSLEARN
tara:strand:- start:152 stop:454 length:303 start_codon:yes stop_codon:yes gene_type:complete